jgi:predicted nucleotidyltransferase
MAHEQSVEVIMSMEKISHPSSHLSGEFLARLIPELDDDAVRAILLHGSYARGNANSPYSDVDLVRIMQETPDRTQQKRFIWRDGYLLNLSSRPLSVYQEWLTIPQEAIFRISTIRDAHILLEKDGAFRAFQQEAHSWGWESLQGAADAYASQLMVELTEVILRMLGALRLHKTVMLVERITLHILPDVTKAVGVQRGIIANGNNYLRQVQDAIGSDSAWTNYYMRAAGVAPNGVVSDSIEQRGIAALCLYQETVRLLRSHFSPEHLETIETLIDMIDQVLDEVTT